MLAAVACGRKTAPAAPEAPAFPARKKWVAWIDTETEIQGNLVTDGSRLFVSTRDAVAALDRVTGKALWRRADVGGLLSAAPGVLIARAESGEVTSLDPAAGRTRWTAKTASSGTLPVVLDGVRVLVAGSRLVGLDTVSGKIVFDHPIAVAAPPVRTDAGLLLAESDGALRLRDSEGQRVLWSFAMLRPLEAPPLVDGKRIFLGTGDRRAVALKLGGKTDWEFKLGTGVPVTPAAAGRFAFFAPAEAVLYAFLRSNGHMSWRAPLPSRPLGPPLVLGRQVLVACHPDELLAFDIDTGKASGSLRAGIERLGAEARPSEIRTPLLVVDRVLYLGVRNPAAVIALEPGAPEKGPSEPPPPFPTEAPLELAPSGPRGANP